MDIKQKITNLKQQLLDFDISAEENALIKSKKKTAELQSEYDLKIAEKRKLEQHITILTQAIGIIENE